MLKNLLVFASLLIVTIAARAQSSVQILSDNHQTVYAILQNPNTYFEESGDNVTICNLISGDYTLTIANSIDIGATKKQITISLLANQKTILRIGNDLTIDKSVIVLAANNAVLPSNPTPVQNRLHPMRKEDFGRLLASVQGQVFDDNKISLITPAAKYAAFTSEQIAQLLSSFQFDETKFKYAKILFPNAIDKENYSKVCGAFKFTGYCNDLMDFVGKQ